MHSISIGVKQICLCLLWDLAIYSIQHRDNSVRNKKHVSHAWDRLVSLTRERKCLRCKACFTEGLG